MAKKEIPQTIDPKNAGNSGRKEIGTSGYYYSSGVPQDEYQEDLKQLKRYTVFERMAKSDGLHKAILRAITLPLKSAKWIVNPWDDKDEQQKDLAKKIEKNLFSSLSLPWQRQLSQLLQSLVFGNTIFEKVWDLKKDPTEEEFPVYLKKLAFRHPSTIDKKHFTTEGELDKITQKAYFTSGLTATMRNVDIPADKLLIFINDDKGDLEGESVYRACYKHWKFKEGGYNIWAVGIEKNAVGYPVIDYTDKYYEIGDSDKQAEFSAIADEILLNYRVHEYAGSKIPRELSFRILEGKLNSGAIQSYLDHHDFKIAQSVLAMFLTLGGGSGSYALSKDQTDFFVMALKSVANDICDTINRHLIPELINYNADGIKNYPYLSCELNINDVNSALTALRTAVDGRIINPDIQIEQQMRRSLELPEIPEEEIKRLEEARALRQTEQAQPPQEEEASPVQFSEGHSHPLPWRRELTQAEKKVNFAEIKSTIDTAEKETLSKIKDIQKKQVKQILSEVKNGKPLAGIDVPFLDEVKTVWTNSLLNAEKSGVKQIEKELNAPSTVKLSDIKKRASERAELITNKYKADLLLQISNSLKGGE